MKQSRSFNDILQLQILTEKRDFLLRIGSKYTGEIILNS